MRKYLALLALALFVFPQMPSNPKLDKLNNLGDSIRLTVQTKLDLLKAKF